jgi:predicted transposase YdaD
MAVVIDPMKNSVLREWYEEAFAKGHVEGQAEGRMEGRMEGRIEGRVAGQIDAIRQVLEDRFGPLPEWVRERLVSGTSEQRQHWLKRMLEAQSLSDVFQQD